MVKCVLRGVAGPSQAVRDQEHEKVKSSRPRRKWQCTGCGVSASRVDGRPMALPENWEAAPEGAFCLLCRRERAAALAVDAVPGAPSGERAEIRRAALIEFEVSRRPELSNGTIARACRCAPMAVAAARARLCLPEPTVFPSEPARSRAAVRARPRPTRRGDAREPIASAIED